MITININGKEIKLEKPVTVLEAARSAGIKIPTLCYHEQLEKYGGCRLCLVEVEKIPRLQTACTLMVTDGMVVRTETPQIADVRRGILEFLLINHPLDCPYCDKAGECELQDLVEKYGPAKGRYKEKKRKAPESLEDPVIVRNMERCIMCTRCVRMCEGVQGASAIAVIDRGGHSHVEPFSGGKYDCEYCGNCVSVCPVGAIMSRLHRHSYRPWQVKEKTETICPYCGVGCTVIAQVRDDSIKRVIPKIGSPVNNGMLCSRGRFGYEFVGSSERLTSPMIKKNGVLEQATWEEAISLTAKRLGEIKNKYGGSSIAGIASPRCTNEDNYVFQKFMRIALGTNNIDSAARTGYAGTQTFIENIFGQGATANIIAGLSNSDSVLVIGGDPTAINPILGLQIRACSRKGGSILAIGHIKGLEKFNPLTVSPRFYTETVLLEGIVSALKNKKGLSGSNPVLEAKIKGINTSAKEVENRCGIAEKDFIRFTDTLSESLTPAIVLGKDIVQSSGGSYKLMLISAINYLMNARIYLLCERANEQGLLDMGCAPDLLPGYRPLAFAEFRKRYENAWKSPISEKPGLSIFEMVDSAKSNALKAMYIMGENPVFNLPNSKAVTAALKNVDFIVVQDIFLTETGKLADVVFPALSWAEKDGTFTNMERRIQRLRKAVNREGMEDWRIISEVSKNMGVKLNYSGAEEIFQEISRISPLHRDLTYEEIEKGDAIYPYKGEPLRGVMEDIQMHNPLLPPFTKGGTGGITDGKLYLRLERPLFHSGTLSTKAPALVKIYPEAVASISPATGEALSLKSGDMVKVSTSTGSLELPVNIDNKLDNLSVMLTNNFENKGAFSLMEYTIDPVTKAPVIDANEVKLEKSVRLDSEVRA
ncbi:MAG: NADH-quinone oxidoreductase subunit NuoG [Thermodesulfovibrionales bacterium]|nr:NADH-quinone oxidoreductase subunit NuoG [Thermodesulfovibrionales bacterium]